MTCQLCSDDTELFVRGAGMPFDDRATCLRCAARLRRELADLRRSFEATREATNGIVISRTDDTAHIRG